MKQIKTFQYKLKPTDRQRRKLAQHLGTCRFIYNLCLEYKKTLWDFYKIPISEGEMKKELARLAHEVEWIASVNAQTRELVVTRLYRAYETFYRKGGFPKFANKTKYKSIDFRQDNRNCLRINQAESTLNLPKFGLIRFHNSQPCEGKIKTASVKKLADGWYVNLAAEVDIEPYPEAESKIGIDLGIRVLMTTSEGEKVYNPKYHTKYMKKLRRLARSVSRKEKGSNNRAKAAHKLAKLHHKVARSRKDFHHKLTSRLVDKHQTIVTENVSPSGLIKTKLFSRALSDASWGMFLEMLKYKSAWYGRTFYKVAPHYTTATCSICGTVNQEIDLKQRHWLCPNCNAELDRDINAAINIKNKKRVA